MKAHVLIAGLLLCLAPAVAQAAAAEDAKAALTKAEASEATAGTLRNQWTATEDTLKAARKALAAGDYDKALSSATLADALAQQSIAQAKEQSTAWQQAVLQ